MRKLRLFGTPEGGELHLQNVGLGSRLCENSGAETFRAIIESGRQRGRIIIAAEADYMTKYFVSVSKN
jgi:hypothetical protein